MEGPEESQRKSSTKAFKNGQKENGFDHSEEKKPIGKLEIHEEMVLSPAEALAFRFGVVM